MVVNVRLNIPHLETHVSVSSHQSRASSGKPSVRAFWATCTKNSRYLALFLNFITTKYDFYINWWNIYKIISPMYFLIFSGMKNQVMELLLCFLLELHLFLLTLKVPSKVAADDTFTGITLAQNSRATSRLRPGDFERCFIKQGDTRLHVAAVLTC